MCIRMYEVYRGREVRILPRLGTYGRLGSSPACSVLALVDVMKCPGEYISAYA